MISTFSLKIFIGISVFCEAFLLFNLLSSFTTSSFEMKLKLKVMLLRFFIRLVIAFILGWFLYLLKASSLGDLGTIIGWINIENKNQFDFLQLRKTTEESVKQRLSKN